MFEFKVIILTDRATINSFLKPYQEKGWEIVSHAMCSNNNISILIRKELE